MPIGTLAASQRVRLLRQKAFCRELACNAVALQADRHAVLASLQRFAQALRTELDRIGEPAPPAVAAEIVRLMDAHTGGWPSDVPPRVLLLVVPRLTEGSSEALCASLARHLALVDSTGELAIGIQLPRTLHRASPDK